MRLAVVHSVDPRLNDARRGRPSTVPTDEDIERCSGPAHWWPFRLRSKDRRMFKHQQLYRLHDRWAIFWKNVRKNYSWFVNDGVETGTDCVMSRFLRIAEDWGRGESLQMGGCGLCVLSWKKKASEYGVDGEKYWHYRWKFLLFNEFQPLIFAHILYYTIQ